MKLAKPFYRLPVHFDAQRLREETAALPSFAWAKHPKDFKGNSSVRLISVGGGENDSFNGIMAPTPHLMQSPYLRQVLASFGVVWSRSRLMKLAPFAGVQQHADAHLHWFYRVRVHIPIVTHPNVRFHCATESVHMAEGEAWIFDNWRLHRVAATQQQLAHYRGLLDAFRHDWRQLYQLGGESQSTRPRYAELRDRLRRASTEHSKLLSMRTNELPAHNVLEARLLGSLLAPEPNASKGPS